MSLQKFAVLLSDLEKQARDYANAKESKSSDVTSIAINLVDELSSQTFILPLKKDSLSANGTTTYLYENNLSYPALFEFIAEVLHTKVPVQVHATKFGPGEIIVNGDSKAETDRELAKSVQALRQLIRAKRSEIASKYNSAS